MPTTVRPGQSTVIGTVTPGLAGDTLTLSQTSGTGTLNLGAVQTDGTQHVIYTAAPPVKGKTAIDQVTYTVADQHNDVVASATASVNLENKAHHIDHDDIVLDRDNIKFALHDSHKLVFLHGAGANIDDLSKGMHLVISDHPSKVILSDFDKDLSGLIDLHGGPGASSLLMTFCRRCTATVMAAPCFRLAALGRSNF